jgi:hypothetical protein
MPERSLVAQLPPEVKEWLDKALIEGNFSGYETLSETLREKGFCISKSSIHRYGKDFEGNLAALKLATEQAKAIVESSPDAEGNMNEALIRLVQQKSFQILTRLEEDDGKALANIGHMVSALSKSSVAVKKYATEVKTKTLQAAEAVEKVAKKGGLSDEAVQAIRSRILGIAD